MFLVPIIPNKPPGEIRRNIVRQNRSTDLDLIELRRAIFDKLYIINAENRKHEIETLHRP